VKSTHHVLKPLKVVTGQMTAGTYLHVKYMNELEKIAHKESPSDCIPWHLKLGLKSKPYDVFLIHAGEQKSMADTMKNLLEAGNLHCFLDKDMKHGSHPSDTMRAALRTCRYTVVILSKKICDEETPLH
jgi:TIR domain